MNNVFSFWERLSVRPRMFAGFAVLIVFSVLISVSAYQSNGVLNGFIIGMGTKSFPASDMARQLQTVIVDTQQIFTDVSATGDVAGLEDAKKANVKFHTLIARMEELNPDAASRAELKTLAESYDTFYERSVVMAEAYVHKGREAGNKVMEDVDKYSAALQLVAGQMAEKFHGQMGGDIVEAEAFADAANRRNLFLLAVALFTGIALSVVVGNAIVGPIKHAVGSAEMMAQGRLDTAIGVNGHGSPGKNELALLTASLRQMQDNLKGMIGHIRHSSSQLATNAGEVAALSSQIAAGSGQQTEQTAQVAASVEEISATIKSVTQSTGEAVTFSSQARDAALGGVTMAQDTIGSINRISETMEGSRGLITSLGQKSDQISEIVVVINDIADQTNLLALNAAIEAARAGEAGRGFAVVADEVRKLAEKTTAATKEIAVMIASIQAETKNAIASIHEGNTEIRQCVGVANRTGEELKKIADMVSRSSNLIQAISLASEEQSLAIEDISQRISNISEVSRTTTEGTHSATGAVTNLSKLAGDLNTLIGRFSLEAPASR
ncbi:MAG: methyl-accepting chemotaxis protein [Nitrospinae bacterium]|nr:methyl-accepting chemotaxis protein [Nitrospinota bacterium]